MRKLLNKKGKLNLDELQEIFEFKKTFEALLSRAKKEVLEKETPPEFIKIVKSDRVNGWSDESSVIKFLEEKGYEREDFYGLKSVTDVKKNILPDHYDQLKSNLLLNMKEIKSVRYQGE